MGIAESVAQFLLDGEHIPDDLEIGFMALPEPRDQDEPEVYFAMVFNSGPQPELVLGQGYNGSGVEYWRQGITFQVRPRDPQQGETAAETFDLAGNLLNEVRERIMELLAGQVEVEVGGVPDQILYMELEDSPGGFRYDEQDNELNVVLSFDCVVCHRDSEEREIAFPTDSGFRDRSFPLW